jgi:hypothetical protein
MSAPAQQFRAEDRLAAKEQGRRNDEQAVRGGVKSPAELKRDNESFAFPKSRAQVNLKSARALV